MTGDWQPCADDPHRHCQPDAAGSFRFDCRHRCSVDTRLATVPDRSATATTSNLRRGEGGSGGSSAPWGTRTVAAPVDSIVADHRRRLRHRRRLPRHGGGGRGRQDSPPLLLSSSTSSP